MTQKNKNVILYILFIFITAICSAKAFSEPVLTHGQLIETISISQPENPFLPGDSQTLSRQELFSSIQKKMQELGISVLKGKSSEAPLSNLEFLNLVYAFSGGPRGNDLAEQKRYLKRNGFISSTDVGLVTEVKGKVIQYHENSFSGKAVTLAAPLFQFDRIQTLRNSRAAFTLDDESRLILRGATNISIDKNIYDPENRFRRMLFRVSKGTAHFIVAKAMKKGSTFTVITPSGVAGVRGTEFVTVVEPDGETRFIVLQGKIETAPRLAGGKWGKRTFIGAGEMQTLFRNGSASKVRKAPKPLLDKLQQDSRIHDPAKTPKGMKKVQHRLRNSEIHSKKRLTKNIREDKKINREDLKQVLAKTTHAIDREALRAFKNISQPSRLDRLKTQYQGHLSGHTLDRLKHQRALHP